MAAPTPSVRTMMLAAAAVAMLWFAAPAFGQAAANSTELDINNPLSILENASRALPASNGPVAAPVPVLPAVPGAETPGGSPSAAPSTAPSMPPAPTLPGGMSTSLSIIVLLTVLTIAPALLVLTTSFTRIVIVLSLLRQAIGTQSLPPSQVIVGLSLFLSLLVMAPTFEQINTRAIVPLQRNEIDSAVAWSRAKEPLRDFMFAQIEHAGNWDDLYMILDYRKIDRGEGGVYFKEQVDMLSLIPAFILSELRVAFLMGFRLYLPFLVIDMVISSVLISMGMLMLPPVLISLPFKLLLFVLVDGWRLVAGNLLNSFAVPGVTT